MSKPIDELFPNEWTQMFYKNVGPNPDDATCWILHVNSHGKREVVQSVCTPGEASELVRLHNKQVAV